MVYGYYCIHPESVDEFHKVASRKNRVERLTALNAPDIILVNERRMYDEQKAFYSDLSQFRARIKKLYCDGTENDIIANYRAVFQVTGFDPATAYSGNDSEYDPVIGDYLRPLGNLSDEAVLGFITYSQQKFDEYLEMSTPKLNGIRALFVTGIKTLIDQGQYPKYVIDKFVRLEQAVIEVDDGFTTTLEKISGWYNAHRNTIVLSTRAFNAIGAFLLFHECFHALAGRTDNVDGFHRLDEFFDYNYKDAFELINETFVNTQSISVLSDDLPKWLKDEQLRDAKLESIIRHTGSQEISRDIFFNAYFSDNIDDVKILADLIKSAFDSDNLLTELQSIIDIESVDGVMYDGENDAEERQFSNEHRFDNIDAYFHYRYLNNPSIIDGIVERAIKKYLAKKSKVG